MWAAEVGENLITKAGQELALLGGSGSVVDALQRATTSTTMRVLAIASGCAEQETSVVSAEAAEAARDVARRGLELTEFTRSIRFGHSILSTEFYDAVTQAGSQPDDNNEVRRVSSLLFKLIDEFLDEMTPILLNDKSL